MNFDTFSNLPMVGINGGAYGDTAFDWIAGKMGTAKRVRIAFTLYYFRRTHEDKIDVLRTSKSDDRGWYDPALFIFHRNGTVAITPPSDQFTVVDRLTVCAWQNQMLHQLGGGSIKLKPDLVDSETITGWHLTDDTNQKVAMPPSGWWQLNPITEGS